MNFFKNKVSTGVAVITPFKRDGSVDYVSLGNIINYLIESKVDFLVALGTTGETSTLTKNERKKIFRIFKECNNFRVPLLMGIGGNDTSKVINDINEYYVNDFDAILSVTPYYNKPSQLGLYKHYMKLDLNVKAPLFIYNVPGRTGVNIQSDTVISLSKNSKNIIGIKDASGNLNQAKNIIENTNKNFIFLSGDDATALETAQIGGNGVISVIAGAYPKLFMDAMKTAEKKLDILDFKEKIQPIIDLAYKEGNPTGIKAILKQKKLCDYFVRLPLVEASESLSQEIKNYISRQNIY